jgi:hypothetical protein
LQLSPAALLIAVCDVVHWLQPASLCTIPASNAKNLSHHWITCSQTKDVIYLYAVFPD